jgi:hypothetical protein
MVNMLGLSRLFIHMALFGSIHCSSQCLPKNEPILKTVERITSVDGKISVEVVDKWFSNHKKSDVGTIASPEAGWQNRARVYGVDCEAVFQVVHRSSLTTLSELHSWLKFPIWTRIGISKIQMGKHNAFVLSRPKINDYLSDHIYVADLDKDRVVIVRMITLGPSDKENRSKAIQEFMQFVSRDVGTTEFKWLNKSKIIPKLFVDKRDAPTSIVTASDRLAQLLTPEEKCHLLKNIHNDYELIEHWPVTGDGVSRLHWIMVYWGLNDPSSPLRKSIRPSGEDLDNSSYILEVVKSTEKLLRDKG